MLIAFVLATQHCDQRCVFGYSRTIARGAMLVMEIFCVAGTHACLWVPATQTLAVQAILATTSVAGINKLQGQVNANANVRCLS